MRVIRREFFNVKRPDVFTIVPIGDVHIGAAACDENLLRSVVKQIKATPRCYWIGMGDVAEWINVRDTRFDPGVLADWVETSDLVDLSKAQKERFLDIVRPVADRCLALVEGNHERTIRNRTERDIHREVVAAVKGDGGLPSSQNLSVDGYGWLQLLYYRSDKREAATMFNVNLHHGFAGGKLAGGKALNMQRWLWTHGCHIALFGHSHNRGIQAEAVEEIDQTGVVHTITRMGAFTGTFLHTVNEDGPSTYSEERGYFPLPIGGVKIELRPGAKRGRSQIKMSCEG